MQSEKCADSDECESGNSCTQLEGQEVLDVIEYGFSCQPPLDYGAEPFVLRTLFNSGQDCAEIVVGQNNLGRLFGYVGTVFAHGYADIGALE